MRTHIIQRTHCHYSRYYSTYRFPNHNPGPVIQHDPAAERRVGMNVNLKDLRDLRLQVLRQHLPSRIPQHGGGPVRLEGVKSLEIQKDVRQRVAGGIAVADGQHVGAQAAAKGGTGLEGVVDERLQLRRNHHGGALQAIGQEKGERAFQGGVVENGAVEKGDEQRFVLGLLVLVGLPAEQVPHEIHGTVVRVDRVWNGEINVRVKGFGMRRSVRQGAHHHGWLPFLMLLLLLFGLLFKWIFVW